MSVDSGWPMRHRNGNIRPMAARDPASRKYTYEWLAKFYRRLLQRGESAESNSIDSPRLRCFSCVVLADLR